MRLFTEFTLSVLHLDSSPAASLPKVGSVRAEARMRGQNDKSEALSEMTEAKGSRVTRPNAYVGQASDVILRNEVTKNLLLKKQYVTVYMK